MSFFRRPYLAAPPGRRGGVEPSIPASLLIAIWLFGAKRMMTAPVRRRLALSGLSWQQLAPVLDRVRTIDAWAAEFGAAANRSEQDGDLGCASAFAYLGQLPLSPFHPSKAALREQFRRCHVSHRSARAASAQHGVMFERLVLSAGRIVAYRETRNDRQTADRPVVLLLPPLASTKEELTLLSDPMVAAGYSVIRMDLPGQGESAAPLAPDSERLIASALDEIGLTSKRGIVAGGISLGAHYALRLAAANPERVRGVFCVSPMAVRTSAQWQSLPEIIYQYLDLYFASENRTETYRLAREMTLETEMAARIACPAALYHAANDRLAQPDAPNVYRSLLCRSALTDRVVADRHGCLLHLGEFADEIARWSEGFQ